jgi:surface antigen
MIGAAAGVALRVVSGGFLGSGAVVVTVPPRAPVNGWPWGQCTWYVAEVRAAMGEPVTWSGDAWQWLENARAQGYATMMTPMPGEIAVYRRGGHYDPRYGHVAIVVAVSAGGYTVAEANYYGLGVVDTRLVTWPDAQLAGFIQ